MNYKMADGGGELTQSSGGGATDGGKNFFNLGEGITRRHESEKNSRCGTDVSLLLAAALTAGEFRVFNFILNFRYLSVTAYSPARH
jgi:hypothetical protein